MVHEVNTTLKTTWIAHHLLRSKSSHTQRRTTGSKEKCLPFGKLSPSRQQILLKILIHTPAPTSISVLANTEHVCHPTEHTWHPSEHAWHLSEHAWHLSGHARCPIEHIWRPIVLRMFNVLLSMLGTIVSMLGALWCFFAALLYWACFRVCPTEHAWYHTEHAWWPLSMLDALFLVP